MESPVKIGRLGNYAKGFMLGDLEGEIIRWKSPECSLN